MEYPIEIIKDKIGKSYLNKFLDNPFKDMVKFVVDIKRGVIAFGGELHSDAQEALVKSGSDGKNIWGGNFYPLKKKKKEYIEYFSLINIKPSENNRSMNIEKSEIKEKMDKVINNLINL